MKEGDIIEIIYWRDIQALKTQWRNLNQSIEEGRRLFILEQFTIGIVIYEDKDMLIIAATGENTKEERFWNDTSVIPKGEIIRRRVLSL